MRQTGGYGLDYADAYENIRLSTTNQQHTCSVHNELPQKFVRYADRCDVTFMMNTNSSISHLSIVDKYNTCVGVKHNQLANLVLSRTEELPSKHFERHNQNDRRFQGRRKYNVYATDYMSRQYPSDCSGTICHISRTSMVVLTLFSGYALAYLLQCQLLDPQRTPS